MERAAEGIAAMHTHTHSAHTKWEWKRDEETKKKEKNQNEMEQMVCTSNYGEKFIERRKTKRNKKTTKNPSIDEVMMCLHLTEKKQFLFSFCCTRNNFPDSSILLSPSPQSAACSSQSHCMRTKIETQQIYFFGNLIARKEERRRKKNQSNNIFNAF